MAMPFRQPGVGGIFSFNSAKRSSDDAGPIMTTRALAGDCPGQRSRSERICLILVSGVSPKAEASSQSTSTFVVAAARDHDGQQNSLLQGGPHVTGQITHVVTDGHRQLRLRAERTRLHLL